MPRVISTGIIQLRYVPTVANTASPTTTELTAGKNLTGFLTRDGLTTPYSGSTVDVAGADNRYNSTASGTYGGDPISLKFFRDNGTALQDVAWSTLPPQTTGFIVIHRFGAGASKNSQGAPASGDRVEVWPIDVISREMMQTADNEAYKFEVRCAIPTPPNLDAVVA